MLSLFFLVAVQTVTIRGDYHGITTHEPEIPWLMRSETARCAAGIAEIKYESTRDLQGTRVTSLRWNDVPLPAERLRWLNQFMEVQRARDIRFGYCFIKPPNDLDGVAIEVTAHPERSQQPGARRYFNFGADGISQSR
ncbi:MULTISPECIES: hypothetical protein [unclassified Sphingomonas]|uniref:hypothetical protein n=1 Tax=unclassified Sphingomonas TaxID=196159 RepID=UPI0008318836|nr:MULTISPECIES: hypothetical protein [unclassified Sphingomonas]